MYTIYFLNADPDEKLIAHIKADNEIAALTRAMGVLHLDSWSDEFLKDILIRRSAAHITEENWGPFTHE